MADAWKQRFEAIHQEQVAAQRAMEEKEAAYKAHVDERIKAVEVILSACSLHLHVASSSKLRQLCHETLFPEMSLTALLVVLCEPSMPIKMATVSVP